MYCPEKVIAAKRGAKAAAELAELAPASLAAQSYQEQCLSEWPTSH